jgi:hypothetical protein
VLAGVLYPAAVHDLDYTRVDRFVTNLCCKTVRLLFGTVVTAYDREREALVTGVTERRNGG